MKKEVKRIKNFYKVCESRSEERIKNEHLKVIEKIKNIYIDLIYTGNHSGTGGRIKIAYKKLKLNLLAK